MGLFKAQIYGFEGIGESLEGQEGFGRVREGGDE